jgi:hypothetical protein
LGDAYKGAATDALTKIGSYLEIGIDVFKGLNDRIESKSSVKEDERPWLKEGQLKKIIERIKNGEPELKETAIKQFKMKAEYKQLIQAA